MKLTAVDSAILFLMLFRSKRVILGATAADSFGRPQCLLLLMTPLAGAPGVVRADIRKNDTPADKSPRRTHIGQLAVIDDWRHGFYFERRDIAGDIAPELPFHAAIYGYTAAYQYARSTS